VEEAKLLQNLGEGAGLGFCHIKRLRKNLHRTRGGIRCHTLVFINRALGF
jgi:hypothetical protein